METNKVGLVEYELLKVNRKSCFHLKGFPVLTFTGTTLTYEPHHEGGAPVTLRGRVERLHHKLMCFGLWRINE